MYHMKYSHSDDNLSFRGQPDKLQNFEEKKINWIESWWKFEFFTSCDECIIQLHDLHQSNQVSDIYFRLQMERRGKEKFN